MVGVPALGALELHFGVFVASGISQESHGQYIIFGGKSKGYLVTSLF